MHLRSMIGFALVSMILMAQTRAVLAQAKAVEARDDRLHVFALIYVAVVQDSTDKKAKRLATEKPTKAELNV